MYISGGGCYRKPAGAAWREKLKRDRRRRINKFAELLAEGWTLTAAARELGLSQQAGSKMLQTIREELGPQAE